MSNRFKTEDGDFLLLENSSNLLLEATDSLVVNPGRIAPKATTTVTFVGTGTTWLGSPPTFTSTGDPTIDASWALGTLTIVDDAHATLAVTTGMTRGVVTWTDSTTSQTTHMTVSTPNPIVMLRPAPTRWYGRG